MITVFNNVKVFNVINENSSGGVVKGKKTTYSWQGKNWRRGILNREHRRKLGLKNMDHASTETGGKTQYEYTRKWIVNVVMADSDISLLIFSISSVNSLSKVIR